MTPTHRPHGLGWAAARALATGFAAIDPVEATLRAAIGGVLAEDAVAAAPVPHYDSSAMDGWAVAGPPPWRAIREGVLVPGQAREVVTGGALPVGTTGVVPLERVRAVQGLIDGPCTAPGEHVRRAGEEAPAGTVLVRAGVRLSPAHAAVLAVAGADLVRVRRPRVAVVLTGDEVVTAGRPGPGRVRDAFDPLIPLAVSRLGGDPLPPVRIGDDPAAIGDAVAATGSDVVVTVGGTGRSGADRLREALADAATVFDGVAMRPGHPALLARLPDGRPLLGLPGNPLAAVAVLLSFLPPLLDGLAAHAPAPLDRATAAEELGGWAGGIALVPCATTPAGLRPAPAARPNMLRGLAASAVLAVVPPAGARAGTAVEVLPLPW